MQKPKFGIHSAQSMEVLKLAELGTWKQLPNSLEATQARFAAFQR